MEEYWIIDGFFKKGICKFNVIFYGLDGKKFKLLNNEDVKIVLKCIKIDEFLVEKVEKKECCCNVLLLYIIFLL